MSLESKILVTGGGGFLGREVVKLLLQKNYQVTSLSRSHYSSLDSLGVNQICCDLSQKEEVEKLDLTGYMAIFHIAAKAGVWGKKNDYFKINFEGTKNLIEKAKNDNLKYLIYTSTPSVVFGKKDILNGDEALSYPPKFYTYYAESKQKAEEYFIKELNDSFKGVALRPHLIWGKEDPHIIPRLVTKAKQKKLRIVGNGDNLVDVIHVKNAALAHVQAFEALKSNSLLNKSTYFIGQERPVNLWNFINQILLEHNMEPISKTIPFSFAFALGGLLEFIYKLLNIYHEPPMTRFVAMQLAKNHYFSHQKAEKDFGYKPILSIEDGLKELN